MNNEQRAMSTRYPLFIAICLSVFSNVE